ncbi:hemolysin family protein [Aquifex aeolicus]|uniref:Hemolysin homolog protein n=1 Tax=Aquifex aeolicus (strain VF5) TaxID=224324 RepID=O67884_AQUAE|nr:hemolysin family protein [Aquifex aeolicus]AAC07855.1 hemolysin homolog protein [Aquifex aeolicus VF5]
MEDSLPAIYTDFLVFLFLLFASGFFSSSEVVFFSVSKPVLMKFSGNRFFKLLMKLLSKPKELLISILIGNELVNVLIASYGTKTFVELFGDKGALLAVAVSSTLIFIFGETIPKNVVLPIADRLALVYAPVFYLFHVVITPLRIILILPVQTLLKKMGVEIKEETFELTEEKLLSLIEQGIESGEFEIQEKSMIEKVLEMDEVLVREVMTPRPKIFALPEDKRVGEVVEEIKRRAHSKIPLYKDVLDNVSGIVHVKELLPIQHNRERALKEFATDVLIIPEVTTLSNFLREIKKYKIKLAVVIDEHGAVSGVVTLYDVLKWIVGEIPEEYEEEKEIEKISADTYRVGGSVSIEELAEKIGLELPEEYDYDTVSGFVMANLGRIPKKGDEFTFDGFKFIVNEVQNNKVKEVIVVRLSEEKVTK